MADTVLVTGASGFVGRATVAAVAAEGCRVLTLEHRWSSPRELRERLDGGRPDRCIHLGWYADPRDYLTNAEANLASLHSTLELVLELGASGCGHLLVAGSSAEYAPAGRALTETDALAPWSVYGAAKASAWLLMQSSLRPPRLEVAWARVFNVTGPGEAPARLLPSVSRAVLTGTPIALSDGMQVRDFLDVRDVAGAFAKLSSTRYRGAVNVSSGEPVQLRPLLTALAQELGDPGVLGWGRRDRSPTDPAHVVGDNSILRGLGWERRFDLASMLAEVASYWRDQSPSDHPGPSTSSNG